ncbi:COG1470 family protein [Planotetraspora kaengkrachanensis]|uniref:Uncharacterized protein n=1 Tax=Planotetraspora kaengkrachanensis TaxID=575193 RepID=A0A8J3PXB7_9ACTN|nr:hypothetical protein [Planotetraspora kaengkrachanensis]GIG82687.1 hypothetical protein Pka01_58140 [Planotetraspora kaengkrachanensis]
MTSTCAKCGFQNVGGVQFCANPACGAYLPWDRARQPEPGRVPVAEQRAGVRVELAETALTVEPGRTTETQVTIHNTGTRVEQFELRLFGPAAVWGLADPAELAVYPGTKAVCVLRFTPPRSSSAGAGRWDFGVLVESSVNAGLHADATGWLTVGTFSALSAELWPQVTRGRGTTEHSLILVNGGNLAEVVKLGAADESGELRLDLPASVSAGPGRTTVPVRVTVVSGQDDGRTFRFTVTATPRDRTPIVVNGSRAVPAAPRPQPAPAPAPPPPRPEPPEPPRPQVVYVPAGAPRQRTAGCLGGLVRLLVWCVLLALLLAAASWAYDNQDQVRSWLEGLQ